MSTTEFEGQRYEIIAWANDQEVIHYTEHGDCEGDWSLCSFKDDNFYFYEGSYGSCSGCDAFESTFVYSENCAKSKAKEFSKGYEADSIVPKETMINLIKNGSLRKILPEQMDGHGDIDYNDLSKDLVLPIKIKLGLEITTKDILECKNQEIKQKALKAYGYEKFVYDTGAEEIHRDGENFLLKKDEMVFVSLLDSSTSRRYILRVPPNMKRTKQAIAWTFELDEKSYNPLVES